jgi:hypothetical protein
VFDWTVPELVLCMSKGGSGHEQKKDMQHFWAEPGFGAWSLLVYFSFIYRTQTGILLLRYDTTSMTLPDTPLFNTPALDD